MREEEFQVEAEVTYDARQQVRLGLGKELEQRALPRLLPRDLDLRDKRARAAPLDPAPTCDPDRPCLDALCTSCPSCRRGDEALPPLSTLL